MTELQLEFIRKFGRRELEFGCYVISEGDVQQIVKTASESTDSKRVMYDMGCGDGIDRLSLSVFVSNFEYPYLQTIEVCKKHTWLEYTKPITEILGHPVQWHDVFARLKESDSMYELNHKGLGTSVWSDAREEEFWKIIPCNPCLSPMEQPLLIQELLLLSN